MHKTTNGKRTQDGFTSIVASGSSVGVSGLLKFSSRQKGTPLLRSLDAPRAASRPERSSWVDSCLSAVRPVCRKMQKTKMARKVKQSAHTV